MANLLHKSITDVILKVYYEVYNELGAGFLEKVYQNTMYFELLAKGHKVEAQKSIKVYFKKQLVGEYFADLIVDDKVIVELKACELLYECSYSSNNELSKSNGNRSGFTVEFWRRA